MSETPRIFLAAPTYDNHRHDGSAGGLCYATQRYRVLREARCDSLLNRNFNFLWCRGLEERDKGNCTHLAMIHADVDPDPWWIDTMMDILEARGADLVSAIIPIKDHHGLTSTAIGSELPSRIRRRLTMHEVMGLPETFGPEICDPKDTLLVNTGLWLCDLRNVWCDSNSVYFHTENGIRRHGGFDGAPLNREVVCIPEDWYFSRALQDEGGTLVATRKVGVNHHGNGVWRNDSAWGTWQVDEEYVGKGAPLFTPPGLRIAPNAAQDTDWAKLLTYEPPAG